MRTPRSQINKAKAAGGKPVPHHVYARRKIRQLTPASPEGTLFHMQNNVLAADKDGAKQVYLLEWPGSTVVAVYGPGEPLKHQTEKK